MHFICFMFFRLTIFYFVLFAARGQSASEAHETISCSASIWPWVNGVGMFIGLDSDTWILKHNIRFDELCSSGLRFEVWQVKQWNPRNKNLEWQFIHHTTVRVISRWVCEFPQWDSNIIIVCTSHNSIHYTDNPDLPHWWFMVNRSTLWHVYWETLRLYKPCRV